MNTKRFWKKFFGTFEKGDKVRIKAWHFLENTLKGLEGIIIKKEKNGTWKVKIDEGQTGRFAAWSMWHFSNDEMELV